jgi:CheY-like chemotaxis protein
MVKILLVEDDKSLREIYGVRLLAEGYDIVSAGDGEEALAMAIKDRPDLIVSDVMMPKISGFDMLDILRSTTETKGIKVIMMTALSSEEQRQRGVALGADRYLVKSQVGIEDVVRTVHEVLGDAPIMSASAAASMAPAAQIAAAPVAPAAPIAAAPIAPAPIVAAPTVAPVVVAQPVAPAAPATPVVTPAPAPAAPIATPAPALPQPTAPFSTPRTTGNTLADRVIQPLGTSAPSPDFGSMMSQELSQQPVVTPAPAPAAPIATPTTEAPSTLSYEETPRPPAEAATPVAMPTPPQPPQTGV